MKKTIYIYISEWDNGNEFEGDVAVKAFGSEEEARAQLQADYEQARKRFDEVGYDEKEINTDIDDDGLRIMIDANQFDDYWEGKIQVEEVTFND